MAKTTGGGNLSALVSFTNSDWDISTGAFVDIEKKFTTVFSGHENSQDLQAVLTHEQFDETITDMFKQYIQAPSASADERYEDAALAVAAISDPANDAFLAITYSGESDDAAGAQRFVQCTPVVLQGGGFTYESQKTVRPDTTLVAVKAGAAVTITLGMFDAVTMLDAPYTVTIPEGAYCTSFWTKAK